MASTNTTVNYALGQFIGTDKPAWLTDYNGDMIKIDLAIKTVEDLASGADTKATNALSSVGTLETSITGILADISALNPYKAKVDALEIAVPLKAPLESPVLTGNPTAPDQTVGNNSSRIANTKFVIDQVGSMAIRKDNTASPIIVNGLWVGTQGQYDALGTKDSNTLYHII